MIRRATLAKQRARAVQIGALAPGAAGRPATLLPPRGQYVGARSARPNTRGWHPRAQSPDSDTVGDQRTLRARARDAVRNMPLAASVVLTFKACVIGPGLLPAPMLDREFLGLSESQADAIETALMRHYLAWATSRWSSFDGAMPFAAQQRLAHAGRMINGDHWVIVRRRQMPGLPYSLSLQHIEADLVSTPRSESTNPRIVDGVEFDENAVAIAIHVADAYPQDASGTGPKTWARVPIFADDADRTRMVWHCADLDRAGQSRGVTRFAAGLETLRGSSEFADNVLTAALNSTIFTTLFKSPRGTQLLPDLVAVDPVTKLPVVAEDDRPDTARAAIPLGSGNTASIFDDEDIKQIESQHPSPLFAPFDEAQTKRFCASTGLPYELVLRSFTASFSASKGAVNEGWKVIRLERSTDVGAFCAPSYRMLVSELAALGLVDMPGFFTDPLRREAWLSHQWVGPVPGHLNPAQEATAAETRVRMLLTTLEQETAEYNGASWERNHGQQAKERRWQVRDDLLPREASARAAVAVPDAEHSDDRDTDSDDERSAQERAA
jgi:lambda family phage portal protein